MIHELQVYQVELEMQNDEIRRAREDVEAVLEKYEDFYEFSPVGFATLDTDGIVTSANLRAAELLGVERSLLVGRRLDFFLASGHRSEFTEMMLRVFQLQGKEACDVELAGALGRRPGARFARIEATTSRSGAECRAVIIDITEQRRAEEEVLSLNAELERRVLERTAQLEASVREHESFSYSVSHDLRAPLRHINCYTTILQEELRGRLTEETAEYLERICAVSRHMGELIDNLLKLPRVGGTPVVKESLDLSFLVEGVLDLLQRQEPHREVEVAVQRGVFCYGDKTLLWVVLQNLLENAWKYTATVPLARIEFSSLHRGESVVYQVRDNGVGFDMAYKDQLFGVFQRLHGNEFAGLGIGLATVERIVEHHGGHVWAEGRPGEGATFFFTLGS